MTDPFLSRKYIARLTVKKNRMAQCRVLAKMGISFRLDAEGYPLVLARELSETKAHNTGPDFSHFEAAT